MPPRTVGSGAWVEKSGDVLTAGRAFVGRQEHLTELERRAGAAAQGRGSAVLLAGPAGIGKTSLVERVLSPYAQSDSALVVGRGYCSAEIAAAPLWPWRQALGAVARDTATGTVLVELDGVVSDGVVVQQPDVAASRLAVLSHVAGALLRAAAEALVVVVVEDLQWADASSRELFGLVAGGAAGTRLLLLGTLRESAGMHLDGAGPAWRLPDTATLRLPPLDWDEVGEYLRQVVGRSVSPATVDRVLRRSGGLPLLLAPAAADEDPGVPALPEIAARLLGQLTGTARHLVEVTALLYGGRTDTTGRVTGTMLTSDPPDALQVQARAGVGGSYTRVVSH